MSDERKLPPRLQDVAREADVHVSTASRVLNGTAQGRISPVTHLRVLDAAKRLGYRPNALARGLKLATTGALGLLVPSLRNPVYASLIHGAFQRAFEKDFVILLAEDAGEAAFQAAYERLVEEGRIDGLLVATARMNNPILEGLAERLSERRVPCVFVNRRHSRSSRNVWMSDEEAGRIAAEHLLELGHQRLGHMAGPEDLDTAQRRTEGFLSVLDEAGIKPTIVRAPYDEYEAFHAVQHLLKVDPRPSALFVSNLNHAIGAFAGVRALGVHVPNDVSFIACDDDPLVEFLEVPLTTIRMPLWELGVAAVDALLDQIDGADPYDVRVEQEPLLIVRRSTAPLEGAGDSPTLRP